MQALEGNSRPALHTKDRFFHHKSCCPYKMDTYGHLYPDKDVKLASRLNEAFGNDVNNGPVTSP